MVYSLEQNTYVYGTFIQQLSVEPARINIFCEICRCSNPGNAGGQPKDETSLIKLFQQ
jgi:hypothetical protein